ncbi:hypothetical protein ASPCADRAFT_58119 [Aspergillus carbonarius ITEM 5010]|uniref:Uncharacterized protein n=1 Tax=Aspergillus carbonarius (strain ITEM 5010) TaxID=602072 RepID=A0A1R3R9A1_ASPC5|nr:hypothetical protein ASPCADRAFT_58119 [Aspergillus carbonarius ITEM 5010]
MDRSGQSRKPRRSSFSQHLQRVFHWDKHVNPEKNNRLSDPLEAAGNGSNRQEQRGLPHTDESIRQGYVNELASFIDTIEDAASRTPQKRNPPDFNRGGLKKLSTYSVSQGASKRSDHSSAANVSYEQEPCGLPIQINKAVHKNERRATKRLEAERIELEKRLLKLEQTGPDRKLSPQRKNARRLTKKQPIRSSSRASSVSADECSSTRLSSLFSSSQRTSRSRSSSLNESDKELPNYPPIDVREDLSGQDLGLQPVTLTMPERFGAMISKELATSNALLPRQHGGISTEANTDGIESRTNEAGEHQYHYEKGLSHGLAPLKSYRADIEGNTPRVASTAPSPSAPPADLDRLSFAATLNLKKRDFEAVQTFGHHHSSTILFPNPATKQEDQLHRNHESIWKAHIASDIGPHAAISPVRSSAALQGELSKSPSKKSPTDRYLQRHHKKYIPSPLAESSSLDGNSSLFLHSRKTTTMLKLQASGNMEQTPSPVSTKKDDHPRYGQSHPRPGKRLLTWDVKKCEGVDDPAIGIIRRPQERSPARRSCPWLYGTTRSSSVDLSGHRVKYIGQGESVEFQDPRLHDKTHAYQEKISRGSHSGPQSGRREEYHVSKSNISQPSESNSSFATSSEEPQSEDYDTADEARSPVLLPQEDNVRPVRCPDHDTIPTGDNVADGDMLFSLGISTAAVSDRPEVRTNGRVVDVRNLQANRSIDMRFVICCHCSHWHDIPSDVYARLSPPDASSVARARRLSVTQARKSTPTKHTISNLAPGKTSNLSDSGLSASSMKTEVPIATVPCCWCSHDMNRSCCPGWSAIVHMRRRHH